MLATLTQSLEAGAASVPKQLKDGGHSTIDDLVEINLGTDKEPRLTYVSTLLSPVEREQYREFLMEHRDYFAWTYNEMPGFDPLVATLRLVIDPNLKPIKQMQRCFQPELQDQISPKSIS